MGDTTRFGKTHVAGLRTLCHTAHAPSLSPDSGTKTHLPTQPYVGWSVKNTVIKVCETDPAVTHGADTDPACKEDVILPGEEEEEQAGTGLVGGSGEGQGKESRAVLLREPASLRGWQKSYSLLSRNVFV